jgi:hypothetical protein
MMLKTLMEYHSPSVFCGSTNLYSNSYSNADDKRHFLAIPSEQQSQEISTKRTPANMPRRIPYSHPHSFIRYDLQTPIIACPTNGFAISHQSKKAPLTACLPKERDYLNPV